MQLALLTLLLTVCFQNFVLLVCHVRHAYMSTALSNGHQCLSLTVKVAAASLLQEVTALYLDLVLFR